MPASLQRMQRLILSSDPLVVRASIGVLLAAGGVIIALFIGIAGPLVALAAAAALVGGALILVDTHWGFVALAGVALGLPFASLPFSIGFRPTFLDVALGALFLVWLLKLAIGQERTFLASPLGIPVAVFMLLAVFSFAYGLAHSPASTFLVRRFAEILLGVGLFFVAVNTVRTPQEVTWVSRWLMFAGSGTAVIAIVFYFIPETWTVAVLDRLARFDYPGGHGALRYIEDDPDGVMRAIGTAVDPNVLGGMMVLIAALLAPQLAARVTLLPRWLAACMLATACLALYLTYSRSALLGFGASLALLAFLRYRRLIWIGVLGLALLMLLPQTQAYLARLAAGFAGEDLATQMRFGEYKDALILIARYPVFGVGFTGVPDIDIYLGVSMVYLIIAQNMGLIGLICFVAVFAGFFGMAATGWRAGFSPTLEPVLLGLVGGVAGALVSGIFDHYWFNMTYPHMTVLLWLFTGLATATILVQQGTAAGAPGAPVAAQSSQQMGEPIHES